MAEAITICVPTYERPKLLRDAIHSCFAQTFRPLRIVIGDDSRSSDTADMIAALSRPDGVELDYLPRANFASQRENVIRLFEAVTTTYVSLLHDDDLFAPRGLDAIIQAASRHPAAIGAFGVQEVVNADGSLVKTQSEQWNRMYHRTGDYLDRLHTLWFSVLTLQLPSNGYLLKAKFAKIAAAAMPTVPGSAVDVAFALRLAEASNDGHIFVCSDVTHRYRLTPGAETERLDHLPIFELLRGMAVPEPYKMLQSERLAILLIATVNERLSRGDIKIARQLIFSADYPAAKRWRPMGMFHTAAASLRLPPSIVRLPYAVSRKRRFAH
jgi:hypothetical protein